MEQRLKKPNYIIIMSKNIIYDSKKYLISGPNPKYTQVIISRAFSRFPVAVTLGNVPADIVVGSRVHRRLNLKIERISEGQQKRY